MKIGYACLVVGVPDTGMKTTRKANATPERLTELIAHNLKAMENMIDYNIANGIKLYRISSDIIPFGSDYETNQLNWTDIFKNELNGIAKKIEEHGLRVSMHPGQYTVLNSKDVTIVKRAIEDLEYHTAFLDALNLDQSHKIILHVGGVYGDKISAVDRFIDTYQTLSPAIKNRLIIENDDRLYTIEDVLEISERTGAPVVYDNLHNAANPSNVNTTDAEWIQKVQETWTQADGATKIHYSQQRKDARVGAHTETIYIEPFMAFYKSIEPLGVDIMLEVKDKNLSAVKVNATISKQQEIRLLEKEWARYKYLVLSKSQHNYQAIRSLLKDKTKYPAVAFYSLIEQALDMPSVKTNEQNALEHVWGHLKKEATEKERNQFQTRKTKWLENEMTTKTLKNWLKRLAEKYEESYLLESLYFDIH